MEKIFSAASTWIFCGLLIAGNLMAISGKVDRRKLIRKMWNAHEGLINFEIKPNGKCEMILANPESGKDEKGNCTWTQVNSTNKIKLTWKDSKFAATQRALPEGTVTEEFYLYHYISENGQEKHCYVKQEVEFTEKAEPSTYGVVSNLSGGALICD